MTNINKTFIDNKLAIKTLDKDVLIEYFDDILMIDTISLGHYKLWHKDYFFEERPEKWSLSKIALLDDKPIGYCIASLYAGKKGQIHRISTHPQFRGNGIGRMLVQQVIFEASHKVIVEITLESLRDNYPANEFYKKLGFRELKENAVKKYLIEKNKMIKINEFYALNKIGNRRVFSIRINSSIKS